MEEFTQKEMLEILIKDLTTLNKRLSEQDHSLLKEMEYIKENMRKIKNRLYNIEIEMQLRKTSKLNLEFNHELIKEDD